MLFLGGTIALSIIEKIVVQTTLVKNLADKGYRIDKFKFLKFEDLILFIPILNIIRGIKHFIGGYILLDLGVEQLACDSRFVQFTEHEMKKYNSSKTTMNALKMNMKLQVIPTMLLAYTDGGSLNEILFAKEDDRYIIVSTKGHVSELTRKKQYLCLEEQMREIDNHFNSNIPVYQNGEEKRQFSEVKEYENKFVENELEKPKVFIKNREVIKEAHM